MFNTNTVPIPVLLSTYHAVLIDVILILVFLIGFKFFTTYLMVIMTKWFDDEDEDEDAPGKKPAKSSHSATSKGIPFARKVLWIGFAALWILNGVDQFRSIMVAQSAQTLVQASLSGSPTWLGPLLQWIDHLWAQRPIWSNISSAVLQLIMGLLLLLSRDKMIGKVTLWVSIIFSLFTWVLGEEFGILLHSGGSFLIGGPGAGLLYGLTALLLLTPVDAWRNNRSSEWIRVGFSLFWLLCAGWRLIPVTGLWTRTGVLENLQRIEPNVPWLAFLHSQTMSIFASNPAVWNLVLVVIFLSLAALTWWKFESSVGLAVPLLWILLSWVLGQGIGMAGGMGLPLNSGPVLALALIGGWLSAHRNTFRVSMKATAEG